ncbi:MAG: dTDP-4-dehydrorhamnose 3,5-epimerase family protein [Alphaproteobacteria bacterium]
MKIHSHALKDAKLIECRGFSDNRGQFTRIFCSDTMMQEMGLSKPLKHINHSFTARQGTIRGLRYQTAPALEAKVVRCIRGRVFDVMIDLRKGSETFLKTQTTEISRANNLAVYVPEGFAHGFQSLEDETEVIYMTTAAYNKECERSVRYSDPLFSIQWPLPVAEISEHDDAIPFLSENFEGI